MTQTKKTPIFRKIVMFIKNEKIFYLYKTFF